MKKRLGTKKTNLIILGSIAGAFVIAAAVAVPVALAPRTSSAPSYADRFKELQAFATKWNVGYHEVAKRVFTLNDEAFAGRTDISADFAIPSLITGIGANAFRNATLPLGFQIPAWVARIDNSAFDRAVIADAYYWNQSGPVAGAKIDLLANNPEYVAFTGKYRGSLVGRKLTDRFFENVRSTPAELALPADFALPAFVRTIGVQAFYGAHLPSAFRLPDGVTSIETNAFLNATVPAGFTLPARLATVGASAFGGVTFPGALSLPSGLTSLVQHDAAGSVVDATIFEDAKFPAGLSLGTGLREVTSRTFDQAEVPLGFAVPATLRIWARPSGSANGALVVSADNALQLKLPANATWSDARGGVAGSVVVAVAAAAG